MIEVVHSIEPMGCRRSRAQEPNRRLLRVLLRARRERPRRHAAEKRDELAASQLIVLHSISHQPGAG
jgi:hypothetical protein